MEWIGKDFSKRSLEHYTYLIAKLYSLFSKHGLMYHLKLVKREEQVSLS